MRRAFVPLIALTAIAVPSAALAASSSTKVYTGVAGGYQVKPASLSTEIVPIEKLQDRNYKATGLKWRSWGKATTTGRGRLQVCVKGKACQSYSGRIQLKRPVSARSCKKDPTATGTLYSRVRFSNPDRSLSVSLRAYPC